MGGVPWNTPCGNAGTDRENIAAIKTLTVYLVLFMK